MEEENNFFKRYSKLVEEAFFREGIVDGKSYSHKPHLQDLPHDLMTNDKGKLQERYDELTNKIDEIEKEYGWIAPAHGSYYEPDSARDKRMEFYEKKFKKLDKRIYKECKDLVNELKPLMDKVNEIYSEYRYGHLTNYGEYGELNPYEAFNLFYDQFKSKNAGKGNIVREDGFHTFSPDEFSFEKGNSYLNYVLSNIMHDSSFVLNGYTVYDINKGQLPQKAMDAMPKDEINNILNKLSDLKADYDYECRKIRDDYKMKTMKEMNELRDYEYERDRLERYCKNNDIPIETRK